MIHRRRDGLVDYYRLTVAEGLWTMERRVRHYTEFLFQRIRLDGRSVLNIGGWCAHRGRFFRLAARSPGSNRRYAMTFRLGPVAGT